MREYANEGYVISLTNIEKIIPAEKQEVYEKIRDGAPDSDELLEFVSAILEENGCPTPDSVFSLGNEDSSDDLERGETYFIFSESDLYEKKETEKYQALRKLKLYASESSWITFG